MKNKQQLILSPFLVSVLAAIGTLALFLTALAAQPSPPSTLPHPQESGRQYTETISMTTYLPMIGRWYTQPCVYQEVDGRIIIEVESAPSVDAWQLETTIPGYFGDGYYTWHGPDLYGTPGVAILNYPISITTPGWYELRIHNYHGHPDWSLENDVFVQMDHAGWIKAFSGIGQTWNWALAFDYGNHHITTAEYNLTAGYHLFQISARSNNFSIDRIVFYNDGNLPTAPDLPESACVYYQ